MSGYDDIPDGERRLVISKFYFIVKGRIACRLLRKKLNASDQ